MKLIGLTGNIACGKSTVANILRNLGIPVVDADQVGREIVDPNTSIGKPGADAVMREFGTIDKTELRQLVFNDPAKRKKLESILHPLIRQRSMEIIDAHAKKGAKIVIYEAALLVETGLPSGMSGLLLITCPNQAQLTRMLARDPTLKEELAKKILASQLPELEKRKAATWVIENSGSEKELESKVKAWLDSL